MATAKRQRHPTRRGDRTPIAPSSSNDEQSKERSIEINKELLRKYGVEDSHEVDAVETFTRNAHFYGNDALCHGLSNMFKGMVHAVRIYTEMKEEIHSLHEGIMELRNAASDAKDQTLVAETIARQKVEEELQTVGANYDTAIAEIARIESLLQDKESAISHYEAERAELRFKLQELEQSSAAAHGMAQQAWRDMQVLKDQCIELESRLRAATVELDAAAGKQHQLTSLPGAPFYDYTTHAPMDCPVLQNNGHIVPLKAVISQWFSIVTPDDGTLHRTYICPLTRTPTTLASMATQDRIRHIAQHTGIDITLPLTFGYQSDTGDWTEFQFQDQLSIVARICAVQTMQMSECIERLIVQHNSMTLEINAAVTQARHFRLIRIRGLLTHNAARRAVSTSNASPSGSTRAPGTK